MLRPVRWAVADLACSLGEDVGAATNRRPLPTSVEPLRAFASDGRRSSGEARWWDKLTFEPTPYAACSGVASSIEPRPLRVQAS